MSCGECFQWMKPTALMVGGEEVKRRESVSEFIHIQVLLQKYTS
jgi:hypothetical protein